LNCDTNQLPGRAEELFTKWKKSVKKNKEVDKNLTSKEVYSGDDTLKKLTEILRTQPEHIVKTLKRFKSELENS